MHQASIGDTLLATPVYREIKNTYPGAELILVTSHVGQEMLRGNPYIDKLVAYKKGDPWWHVVRDIWRADAALILDFHYRNALYSFLAMIPKRIGRGKGFINVPVEIGDELKNKYEPYRYLQIAKHIGVEGKSTELGPLCPTAQDEEHVECLLRDNGLGQGRLVLLAPYSLDSLKDWAPAKYQRLIELLQEEGCSVALTGGKENRQRAEDDFQGAMNLMGETNLRETQYLISRADLLICGCTSVLHISATTDTPSVAIYGPSSPEQWTPKKNCTVISHNFPCSPCHMMKEPPCRDNQCIKSISVEEVWVCVKQQLG